MGLYSAHRGGASERAENTMGAFDYAYKLGCNYLELDINMTKDKQVLIFHDETLERLCGEQYKDMKPEDFNYADMPPIMATYKSDYTNEPSYTLLPTESNKMTLLEDLFKWAQVNTRCGFSIDTKKAT